MVTIIGADFDEGNLRLREALLISKQKPQINNRFEMDAFRDFFIFMISTDTLLNFVFLHVYVHVTSLFTLP